MGLKSLAIPSLASKSTYNPLDAFSATVFTPRMSEKFSGKIIKLTSENVKRLQCVEITPSGELVVVAGENGAGKSSVLDSIMYALGGAATFSKQPVRKGEEKAKVSLDLGEFTVTRTITAAGGGSLVVMNKEGLRYPSPQAILDRLMGSLSFDPLDFSRKKPEEQSVILRALAGLDFSADDQEIDRIFSERTLVNRDVKSLEARIGALPAPKAGLPTEETPAADVLARQQKAMEHNAENQKKVNALAEAKRVLGASEQEKKINDGEIQRIKGEIANLQDMLKHRESAAVTIEKELDQAREVAKQMEHIVSQLKDEPLEVFQTELAQIEEINKAVRQQMERTKLVTDHKEKKDLSDKLTKDIETIEKRKLKKAKEAKYPIDGLSVATDGSVMFKDLPFEQASSAEQLRASVAIGLALNPKLRVLLIRDGSLLDTKSWALLSEVAKEADAQVWIEKVGTEGQVSVIIEDGLVKA